LIYEGHDQPRTSSCPDPKAVDQLAKRASGSLTQNGKFEQAAQAYKRGKRSSERVRVYEKIRRGIWSYNGVFHLVDSQQASDKGRKVFKFRLVAVEGDENFAIPPRRDIQRRRVIPTAIKLEVWQRDGGKCVRCGADDELHFDHD